mmetsp:Transcript_10559/g.25751  ORF Transcript_10559/g.25751 Transcript_10559/m.25751 type:complete len:102 (+) Transcript_10559:577-882(+)
MTVAVFAVSAARNGVAILAAHHYLQTKAPEHPFVCQEHKKATTPLHSGGQKLAVNLKDLVKEYKVVRAESQHLRTYYVWGASSSKSQDPSPTHQNVATSSF